MPEALPLRPADPVQIGPFRLTGRLGEGGQGVVYSGLASTGEQVAVKLLHTRFTDNVRARSAFAHELKAAQKVDPFCTARILAADVEGDIPYITSEYIHGLSLKRTVQEWGPRAGTQLNRLAIGTATALVAIHKAGVVHRDFKPSNVLLGPDGPRVIDFGVGRVLDLTGTSVSTGGPVGTPAYMAPEQFNNAPTNPAVDVFAWASTLVYASCGEPPFGNDSISQVIGRILHSDPELGALTGGLREMAAACLAKNPYERPTAEQLLLNLIGTGKTDDVAAWAPSPPAVLSPRTENTISSSSSTNGTITRTEIRAAQRAARRKTQTRNTFVAGAAAALAVAGVAGYMLWPSAEEPAQQVSNKPMSTGTATKESTPLAGDPLTLHNTEGLTYTISAVRGGTDDEGHAYIDYVLSNNQEQPVPLETPGDLFIKRDQAPEGASCMEQPGAASDMCTIGNTTTIKSLLDGSEAPIADGDEQLMPAGASYLLRTRSDDPVSGKVEQGDLRLYVWQVRFVNDRKAIHIQFP